MMKFQIQKLSLPFRSLQYIVIICLTTLLLFCLVSPIFAQTRGHAFLIASPFPDVRKINALPDLKSDLLEFADLTNQVNSDLRLMKLWLKKSGFKPDDITILNKPEQTIQAVTDSIKSHVKSLEENALVLFYYTGHGLQILNKNQGIDKEKDSLDECLVFKEELWVDDNINLFYTTYLSKYQNIMIMDACSMGTGYRFTNLSKREKLIQKYTPILGDDYENGIDLTAGCAPFFVDTKHIQYNMIYIGACNDNQESIAFLDGSWLTNRLVTISEKPQFKEGFTYRNLFCALHSFAEHDPITFSPSYIEVGDCKVLLSSVPLKIN